MKIKSKSILF